MNPRINPIIVLAILLCAAIFIGEALTYGVDIHNYETNASYSDGTLNYSVGSSGSDVYSVVVLDNKGFDEAERLYIYIDDGYAAYYDDAKKVSDITNFEQSYFADQIKKMLRIRGFDDVTFVNDEGLIAFIDGTHADAKAYGLVVMSYSLPSDIYSGKASDPLLEWISNGGSLYWVGSEIGKFYSDNSGIHEVSGNQVLFFGKECINVGKTQFATSAVDNGFKDALSLKNSNVKFGMDTSGLDNAISMGYCEGGYSSTSMVGHGKGMICVFSGIFSVELMDDVAQVIASGTTYATEIVSVQEGKVVRSAVKGTIDASEGQIAYIYIGGTYPVHAEAFRV